MRHWGRARGYYGATQNGRDASARRSLPSPPEKERPRGRPFGALSEQKLRSQLSEWRSTTGRPGGETALRKQQLWLETEAYDTNIEQRRTKANKALRQGGASLDNVAPLRRIADSLTIPLAEALENMVREEPDKHRYTEPENRPGWYIAAKVLGAEGVAAIAVKALLPFLYGAKGADSETELEGADDAISGGGGDGERGKIVAASAMIGKAIRMASWLTTKYGKRPEHVSKNEFANLMSARDAEWRRQHAEMVEAWDNVKTTRTGRHLLALISKTSNGLVQLSGSDEKGSAHASDKRYLSASPQLLNWLSAAIDQYALNAPGDQGAMVCPPTPWEGPTGGGHLLRPEENHLVTNQQRLRSRLPAKGIAESPPWRHLDAVNALQAVPYRINSKLLTIAAGLRKQGYGLDMKPIDKAKKLPQRPADGADEATVNGWKTECRRVKRENRRLKVKGTAERLVLAKARKLKGLYAPFGFAHHCDFRGRIYARSGMGPSPQGDDFAKHILMFAEGKPIGKGAGPRWLAEQVAKAFGQDKLPKLTQAVWTETKSDWVCSVAERPIDYIDTLGGLDDPWAALAAALEWKAYIDSGRSPTFVTRLPCYIDGTCNGIQHFAALARDPELAKLVNLEPGEEKSDIYQAVADTLYADVSERAARGEQQAGLWMRILKDGAPRRLAKKVVMVKPYGGTMKVTNAEVRKFWEEENGKAAWPEVADEKEHNKLLGWLATRLHKALGSRVEAASEIMQWLQMCSKLLSDKAGLEGVSWRTPSGWPWSNAYLIEKSVQKEATVEGAKVTFRVMTEIEGDPKKRREKRANAISANFVHALDAAALVSAINRAKAEGVSSITAIHDSVGGLAPDMDIIAKAVREGFIEVHEEDPLGSFRMAVLEVLPPEAHHLVPPPPATKGFDIRRVLGSEYFFC